MKKYFLFPILLCGIFLSAQRYDSYGTNGQINEWERNHEYWSRDKQSFIFRYMNYDYRDSPNDLEYFASRFFYELGVKIPKYDDKNSLNITHMSSQIKFTFQSFNDGTIAIAKSPGDSNYEIVIDSQRWDQAHVAEKLWIMWHELAHEFFGTKHGQGGGMMFPISPGTDISLDRLYTGASKMMDWLVSNKRDKIMSFHKEWDFEIDEWIN